MRLAIVFNPIKVQAEQLRTAIDRSLRDAAETDPESSNVDLIETGADDFGVKAIEQAIASEPDVIVVAGGDGTVRLGAGMVSKTDIPLGIVPAGTGNLLARNLELPLALRDAIHVAVTGENRTIDMGELTLTREDGTEEHEPFAVLAGFGLDAAMIANTDDDMKKKVGWVAYIGGFFKAFKSVKRLEITARLDGEDHDALTANTMLIGNAGMLQGGVRVFPDAKVDDGLLDFALIDPKDSLEWVRVMHEVVSNTDPLQRELRSRSILPGRKRIPQLAFKQGKELSLKLSEPIDLQVDGDSVGEIVGLTAEVRAGALTVRVPR